MRGRSLRLRIVLVGVLPLLVAAVVVGLLATRAFDDYARRRDAEAVRSLQNQSRALAGFYARQVKASIRKGDDPPRLAQELRLATGSSVFFLEHDGFLRATSTGLDGLPGIDPDWSAVDAGRTVVLQGVTVPGDGRRQLAAVTGIFLTRSGRPEPPVGAVGALVVTRPAEEISSVQEHLQSRVMTTFLIAAAVAIVLAILLGMSVGRPVRRLLVATRALAAGDRDVDLPARRRDEIGQLERAFVEMAAKIRESEEHERQFLMRVSHELRTPVTAIRSNVEALADGLYDEPDDQARAYAVIHEETTRLSRLIGDLLDLSKLEARAFALDLAPVELEPLLEHAAERLRPRAQEREIELRVDVGGAPIANVDGDRLLQVVGNLLDNALAWTPAGGVVALSVLERPRGPWIVVEDTGPGVPPEKRERIFDPLYSEHLKGTGLGLAIASELIAAMGGRVACTTSRLGGAAFIVELPARAARRAAAVPRG